MKGHLTLRSLVVLGFACLSAYHVVDSASATTHEPQPARPTAVGSVCPSKTVNYITHRLPQQCLKTAWANSNTVNATGTATSAIATGNVSASDTVATSVVASNIAADVERSVKNDSSGTATATSTSQLSPPRGSSINARTASDGNGPSASTPLAHSSTEAQRPTAEPDADADSALDNANFLSFEEWKRRNLARSGQNPEGLEDRRLQGTDPKPRQRPRNLNNALDSLGDDTEIDLDFGRFSSGPVSAEAAKPNANVRTDSRHPSGTADSQSHETPGAQQKPRSRSKDAGKTGKERFNYASFDCAATVLKTNGGCTGASSILVENKDTYMLNECSARDKHFVVELCDDILIDTVVLANFEFFSSIFRTFRVSVSDRYPVKTEKWRELDTFEARNTREIQAFSIENPLIWARYVKIEFLSQYGNEFYCPVSLLRLHGTTMMEEFRHQEELAKGDDEPDDELSGSTTVVDRRAAATPPTEPEKPARSVSPGSVVSEPRANSSSQSLEAPGAESVQSVMDAQNTSRVAESPSDDTTIEAMQTLMPHLFNLSKAHRQTCEDEGVILDDSDVDPTGTGIPSPGALTSDRSETATTVVPSTSASAAGTEDRHNVSVSASAPTAEQPSVQNTTSMSQSAPASGSPSQQAQETNRTASSSTQPPAANPTTQESFFKTVHKRLQRLEANATLSLQYIEEQSQILRDAFVKVEKRQLAKATNFLEQLNGTVYAELRSFRQQYDQIWQSTVIELETQREQSHREILAVSARLGILADQVVLQKRMTIVQSILLLLCLGFVIFSRSSVGNYMDFPVVQNVIARSPSRIRSVFDSPLTSPSHSRPTSSRDDGGVFDSDTGHRRGRSGDGEESVPRLTVALSPASTLSSAELSDGEARTEASSSPEREPRRSRERDDAPPEEPHTPLTPTRRPREPFHPQAWPANGTPERGLLRPGSPSVGGSRGVRFRAGGSRDAEASIPARHEPRPEYNDGVDDVRNGSGFNMSAMPPS